MVCGRKEEELQLKDVLRMLVRLVKSCFGLCQFDPNKVLAQAILGNLDQIH